MGEAAAQLPAFGFEEHKYALLQLYSGDLDPPVESLNVWPNIELGLEARQQNIFGSEIIPTNRDARLRAVVNALSEVVPSAFPEGPPTKPATEVRKDVDDYLHSRVVFAGAPEGKLRRKELVDFAKSPREKLVDSLAKFNHPILQALLGIHALNQRRIAENLARNNGQPVMTGSELDDLTDDLLKATLGKAIKSYYEIEIRRLRQEAKAGDES